MEVSRFDEESLSRSGDPADYIQRAAEGKAREVATRCAGLVLGVDTDVVGPDGRVLGKPRDSADAARMLQSLSGRTHTVYSALALCASDGATGGIVRQKTRLMETKVTFSTLSQAAIDAYVATGDPLDKAGGYGFQGRALAFVEKLDGDPSNVIGLPLTCVVDLLQDFGVELWNFS